MECSVHMSANKLIFSLVALLVSVALIVSAPIVFSFGEANQTLFSSFTQNFQNLAMPLITALSVVFLYRSILANTRQSAIASIDALIEGHVDSLEKFLKKDVRGLPYSIKWILADKGDVGTSDWDVKRLIVQYNAYLSLEKNITQSNIRPAMFEYLDLSCLVNGEQVIDVLTSDWVDLIALLKKRETLEVDEYKNIYVLQRLKGVYKVLEFTDWLEDDELNSIDDLTLPNHFDIRSLCASNVETPAEFAERVSVLESLKAKDLLSNDNEKVIVERIKTGLQKTAE